MHLELMRERSRDFPDVLAPDAVTTARVWHCKYRSLAPVSRLTRLEGLVIATYPDPRSSPFNCLPNYATSPLSIFRSSATCLLWPACQRWRF